MLFDHSLHAWLIFVVVFFAMLIVDIIFLNNNKASYKISLIISTLHVIVALLFGIWINYSMGPQRAGEYLTGYLLEKSLSVDSLFVIVVVFSHLAIPKANQGRVLLWGILGAIFMRAALIVPGSMLIAEFHWVLYIFAIFLVLTGFKIMVLKHDKEVNIEDNRLLRWMRKNMRLTDKLHGDKFITRLTKNGPLYFTPLFVALVLVEFADILFAIDSISAIFAVTTDTFVIYSSNIFAIMGLRSLYVILADMVYRFAYLRQALAILLMFIGGKIFAVDFFDLNIPISISLTVTAILLGSGALYSVYKTNAKKI